MLDMLKERKAALEAQGQKGFTLMEMLIVIAIIAILIAIAIPIFSGQLENAREATDMANVRSAYAEVVASYLSDNQAHEATVTLESDTSGVNNQSLEDIAGVTAAQIIGSGGNSVDVVVDATGAVTINDIAANTSSLTS